MIKVNLLKDSGTSISSGTVISGSSGVVDGRDLLVKFLLVVLPLIGYQVWDQQTVEAKRQKVSSMQSQITKLDQELSTLDVQVKEVEKFLEEKRKLNSQLDTIKKLSKERLRNVKSLDALQSIIPNRAWLTSLTIRDVIVELEGQAVDDIVISDFMRDLDESVFFANVTLESSQELRKEDGSVKRFLIKATLENI